MNKIDETLKGKKNKKCFMNQKNKKRARVKQKTSIDQNQK